MANDGLIIRAVHGIADVGEIVYLSGDATDGYELDYEPSEVGTVGNPRFENLIGRVVFRDGQVDAVNVRLAKDAVEVRRLLDEWSQTEIGEEWLDEMDMTAFEFANKFVNDMTQ